MMAFFYLLGLLLASALSPRNGRLKIVKTARGANGKSKDHQNDDGIGVRVGLRSAIVLKEGLTNFGSVAAATIVGEDLNTTKFEITSAEIRLIFEITPILSL